MRVPGLLGGSVPSRVLPISEPTLPPLPRYVEGLVETFASRQITNDRWVRHLEERAAEILRVPHVVALSSATAGLMLVAKLLGLRGKVLLPSFTFPATLHILLWNRLEPVLVDCDPETFNIDPSDAARRVDAETSAIVPVYIFGNAPDWPRLESIRREKGLVAFSDAAHALGTRLGDRMAGSFGAAEVFSLAPTKVTVAGEGGLVATADPALAQELRIARNYGNPGDYDCLMAGLNARMSEMHALLASLSLEMLEENLQKRERLVRSYRAGLAQTPGIGLQRIDPDCRSTHNYFAIRIDAARFGLSNRQLQEALDADQIRSRIYFHPPLHRQSRFAHLPGLQGSYPNTERVCQEVLCLPLFSHMEIEDVQRVAEAVACCHAHAPAIRSRLERAGGDGQG